MSAKAYPEACRQSGLPLKEELSIAPAAQQQALKRKPERCSALSPKALTGSCSPLTCLCICAFLKAGSIGQHPAPAQHERMGDEALRSMRK